MKLLDRPAVWNLGKVGYTRAMTPVVIGLGSNLQDRYAFLRAGIDLLTRFVALERASGFYETKPMYVQDQPPFLNATVMGTTELGPIALLRALKSAERRVGRQLRERFGPRELDLDLLVYGALRLRSEGPTGITLQVPHARTPERAFVLIPWAEMDAHAVIPGMGSVQSLIDRSDWDDSDVVRVADASI